MFAVAAVVGDEVVVATWTAASDVQLIATGVVELDMRRLSVRSSLDMVISSPLPLALLPVSVSPPPSKAVERVIADDLLSELLFAGDGVVVVVVVDVALVSLNFLRMLLTRSLLATMISGTR